MNENDYSDVSRGGSNTRLKGLKSSAGNNDQPIDMSELENKYWQNLNMGASNPRQFSWTLTPLPLEEIGGQVGDSKYDTGITSRSQLEDVNNTRGELQPWWDLIGAGLAKMGVLAGTTFVNSTVGLLAGGLTAIDEGRWSGIWDNDVNRLMNNINESSEEYFKNYYTNQEMAAPWYANLGTANFIGDKILKNMGFTIGAIGAGALTGGLTSSILAGVKGGNIITRGLASAIASAGEASSEAMNASNGYILANLGFVDADYKKGLLDLNKKYAALLDNLDNEYNVKGDRLITIKGPDGLLVAKSLKSIDFDSLHAQYLAEKNGLDARKKQLEDKVKEDALKVGNTTFGLNQLLLTATNTILFGKILSGGYANAAKAAAVKMESKATGEVIKDVADAATALSKGDLKFTAREGFGKAVATKSILNASSEGFEEGAQDYISSGSQIEYSQDLNTFAKAKINPYVLDNVNSFLTAGNQALQELFGTVNSPGWQDVALGFLTGAMGVPIFKKGGKFGMTPTWSGGVKEAYEEAQDEYKSNDVVDRINSQIQSPEFLARYQGLIRHNTLQNLMDDNVANKNGFEYANNEASLLVNDVLMFRDAGHIDTLKKFFNTYTDLSDEDIEGIKKGTTVQGTNTSIKGTDLNDNIKKDITDRATKLSKLVDNISNIHDYHLIKYGDKFDKEGLEELTWLRASADDHKERFIDNINKLKELVTPLISSIDQSKVSDEDKEELNSILGMSPDVLFSSIINKNNNTLETILKALNKNKERYSNLITESESLKDKLSKTNKSSKATKLQNQIDNLLKLANTIEKSGSLVSVLDLSEVVLDALASASKVINLNQKYQDAIDNPESLNSAITEDKKEAAATSEKIEINKVEETAKASKDVRELKKNIATLNKQDRYSLLDKLSKQEDATGTLAKNLKELDSMHGAFGNLLKQLEFDNLDTNLKTSILNAIDKAYNISNNPKAFVSNFKTSISDDLFSTATKMVDIYNKNKDDSRGLGDETDTPEKPPKAPESIPTIATKKEETPITETSNVETHSKEESKEEEAAESNNPELVNDLPLITKQLEAEESEQILKTIDNSNIIEQTQIVRSDAVTEADTERLFPKGQGYNGRGDRAYVPFSNLKKYEHFINYLTQANAFDFVNKGYLADIVEKDPNTPIHFIVDKSLNNYKREGGFPLRDTVLLAVKIDKDKVSTPDVTKEINGEKYLIVGAIKNNNSIAKNIIDKVISEAKSSEDPIVVSKLNSVVDFIYPGRFATSKGAIKNEERNLTSGDLSTSSDKSFHIAIIGKNNTMFHPTLDKSKVVFPSNSTNNEGKLFLMIKAADGKYYPTALGLKLFNKKEFPKDSFENTPVFQEIKKAIEIFMNTNLSKKERLDARDQFEKYVYIGKRINNVTSGTTPFRLGFAEDSLTKKNFVQVFRLIGVDEEKGPQYEVVEKPTGGNWTISLNGNFEKEFEEFLDLMDYINPRFLINRQTIGDHEMLLKFIDSGILTTNIAALQSFNSNFVIRGLDSDGKLLDKKEDIIELQSSGMAQKNNINGNPEVAMVYYNSEKYKIDANNNVFNSKDELIKDKDIIGKVLATIRLAKQEGILDKRIGKNQILYSMTINGEEYGVLTNKKNQIDKVIFLQEYIDLKDKFDKMNTSNKEEIKSQLDLKDINTHAKDIIEKGYDPSLFKSELFADEYIMLRITLKSTGDVIAEVPFSLTNQKQAEELLKGKEASEEVENSILAPLFLEVLKDNIFKLKSAEIKLKKSKLSKSKQTVNTLLDVKDSESSVNNLELSKNLSIFDSLSREELKLLAGTLASKNISARTKPKIEEAIKELLKVDDATLKSMSVESIISEINCK